MYFSVIQPTPGEEERAVHERLAGSYADHQWLWRWFPTERGGARDFVFRRHEGGESIRFYVVSARRPTVVPSAWGVQTREYAPVLVKDDQLNFELLANPTVRHGRDGKSSRHDVVMEAKQRLLSERGYKCWADWTGDDRPALYDVAGRACGAWLTRRGEGLGFAPHTESLVVDAYQQHQEKQDRQLRFSTVEMRGALTVTDPAAFQRALFQGVGSSRAFGCGLLLIKRAAG